MRDKKKLLALLLFLIMGFFMFTFANPSDTVGTLTKPVEDPKGGETEKEEDKKQEEVVIKVDNAPVITVEPKTVSIAYGTDYNVMTGVKVTDEDNNLVATPSIKDTKELEVGTYTITYTVTDSANHTVTATRTLIVFEDKNNNNLPDLEEEHYDVNFDVEGRGSLDGTTNYAEILTGLTFEEAGIEIPETVADEYYMFVEWTPVEPTSETVVEETVTYVAVFGPINDVNENGIADEEETYTLTIDYKYSRGEKAADSYTSDYVYNTSYKVKSPVIEYYTASKKVVKGKMPNKAKTITVIYTPNNDRNENGIADELETYTVTFVDYDNSVIATVPVLVNEDATLPANPSRAKSKGISYTFNGWSGNYTNVTKDETVKATYVISEIEANVYELKDEFEIPTVSPYYTGSTKNYTKVGTVKLVLTDEIIAATKANKAATVIAYGQENVLPNVSGTLPTVTGYTYNWYVVKYESDGWHIDGKKTINEHTLTVTFNYSRQEKAFDTVTKTVKYNDSYEVRVPSVEYYTANITEVKGNMPDSDVNVDIVYTPNNDRNENGIADELETYTVTFVDYDDSVIATVPVLVNEDATVPADPTRDTTYGISYEFAGWDGSYTNVTENQTVKATYNVSKVEAIVVDMAGKKLATAELYLNEEILANVPNAGTNPAKNIVIGSDKVPAYVKSELPANPTGYTYYWGLLGYNSEGFFIMGRKIANEHTLTVTFNYSRQEQAFEPVTKTVKYAEKYEVEVPTVEYYTANITEISGTMDDEDLTINVVYTPNNDRNENGIADELDPKYTVTFIVRGPGKFSNIQRVIDYAALDTNDVVINVVDDNTIIYSNILEGLTYAEWANSTDGKSYICSTSGEINASVKGSWLDAQGNRYNNLAKVYADATYYMDYYWDLNGNGIDDEKEEKASLTFEITGTEGVAYFNEAKINAAKEAGASVATRTKIVYEGIVKGATINKYGYSAPTVTTVSGGKCSGFNPTINAFKTKIEENTVSSNNCIMDKNNNNIEDSIEDKYTLSFKVENGTFTPAAKTYFEGKGAIVTDTEIKFTNLLSGTKYNTLYNDPNKLKTEANEGATLVSSPTIPNYTTAKVEADTTYTWVYAVNEYTVKFYNENKEQIGETQTVKYGEDAIAPEYTKDSTEEFEYTVTWNKSFTNVKSNLEVYAVVTSTTRSYTVTFKDYDGSTIGEPQTIKYGENAVAPENPTRENYTFNGWSGDYTNISGNTEVTATYTANIVSLEAAERENKDLIYQVNEDKDITTLIVVYAVDADGIRTEVTNYTTNLDVTRAVENATLVISYEGLTNNSLTYSVRESAEEAFDSKFEVFFNNTLVNDSNGYYKTKSDRCTSNCASSYNTEFVKTDNNILEIVEHYSEFITVTNVTANYTDGSNLSLYIPTYKYHGREKFDSVRWTHVNDGVWNPVYIAQNAEYETVTEYYNEDEYGWYEDPNGYMEWFGKRYSYGWHTVTKSREVQKRKAVMTDEKVINTVSITYNREGYGNFIVVFTYNATTGEFVATSETQI